MRSYLLTAGLALLGLAAVAQPAPPPETDSVTSVVVLPPARPMGVAKTSKFGQFGNLTIVPIPVLFYQQETGLGYGLGGLLSGRFGDTATTRPSNVRIQYWTTQEKQALGQLVHTIYTPGESFYLNGEISAYDKLKLYYYGIGNDNRDDDESYLTYQLFIVNQRLQKRIVKNVFFGALYRLTDVSQFVYDEKADNGGDNYFGRDPRLNVDPRQRKGTTVSGLGPVFTYDTRDVPLAAFRGNLVDFGVTFNGTGLGSDYRFVRYQLDLRHFQPLGSTNNILALQYVAQLHTGDVPFRELAGLGANLGGMLYNNSNLLRGIYEQRYRDKQMMMFQAEVRHKLFPNSGSDFMKRFDLAAFGGVGQTGQSVGDYTFGGTKVAGGAGIHINFLRDDRVNLRFDYAGGTGSSPGLYFAIGEAF